MTAENKRVSASNYQMLFISLSLPRRHSFGSSRNLSLGRKDCVTSQKKVCVGGYISLRVNLSCCLFFLPASQKKANFASYRPIFYKIPSKFSARNTVPARVLSHSQICQPAQFSLRSGYFEDRLRWALLPYSGFHYLPLKKQPLQRCTSFRPQNTLKRRNPCLQIRRPGSKIIFTYRSKRSRFASSVFANFAPNV